MSSKPDLIQSFPENLPRLSKKILKENNLQSPEQLIAFARTHFLAEMTYASGKVIGKLTLQNLKALVPEMINPIEQFYANFSTKAVTVLKREQITSLVELEKALSGSKKIKNARGAGEKIIAELEGFLLKESVI
jgi:hypothetical protein